MAVMHFKIYFCTSNKGYPEAERNEIGYPGFPPATQWTNENILVQRLSSGQHLLYREATGQGMSGSPLYFMDEKQQKAFAVGVHVGGSKRLANTAVPISYHMKTFESWNSVCPVRGKYVTALETKKFCIDIYHLYPDILY